MRKIQNKKRRRCRQYIQVRPKLRYILLNSIYDGWDYYVLPYAPEIRKVVRVMIKASIAGFVLTVITYSFLGQKIGCLQAKYDLWRRHYEIRIFTSSRSHEVAYRKLLDPYGIRYRRVDDYPASVFAIDLVKAYNSTMKKAIQDDLGVDVDALFKLFGVLDAIEANASETAIVYAGFYEDLKALPPNPQTHENKSPMTIMKTSRPTSPDLGYFKLSECNSRQTIDLIGDPGNEVLCLRELSFKDWDRRFKKKSVVVDLCRNGEKILRQELDLGVYSQESFSKLIDLDADGRPELVTSAKFGPECAGCSAVRVYQFMGDRFERVYTIVSSETENNILTNFHKHVSSLEALLLKYYIESTGLKRPCGYYQDCIVSEPWLLNVDADMEPECVFLAQQPYDADDDVSRYVNIIIAELADDGQPAIDRVHSTRIPCDDGFLKPIGFLETRSNQIHLLINFSYGGTSVFYPILHVFEFGDKDVQQVGEFAGFYEHVIGERLMDIDRDGTSEIVYVQDAYWPPGGAHVDVIPIYGIAAYINGQYREADRLFENTYRELNRFMYHHHSENHSGFPDFQ